MQKNYIKRSLMLLGVAALSASAFADTYVDITSQYIKDPTFVPAGKELSVMLPKELARSGTVHSRHIRISERCLPENMY